MELQSIFDFLQQNKSQILPLVLSCITAYTVLLAGNLNKKAWLVGLFNQLLWLTWILTSKNYGFIPMNAVMWIVYYRNHLKWKKMGDLKKAFAAKNNADGED